MKNLDAEGSTKGKVCMFVYNNFLNDSRVQKEAETLTRAGYQVTVLALLDENTSPFEKRNNVRIFRVPVNPWHLRVLRCIQTLGTSNPIYSNFMNILESFKDVNLITFKGFNISLKEAIFAIFLLIIVELLFLLNLIGVVINSNFMFYGILASVLLCSYFLKKFIKLTGELPSTILREIHQFLSIAHRVKKKVVSLIGETLFKTLKPTLMLFHRYFCFFSYYRNCYLRINRGKYDVFHAHDLNTLPIAYVLAKQNNAKLVYDSHELYVERNKIKPSSRIKKHILRHIEGYLVRRSDAVFTVNRTLAAEMARRYKIKTPGIVMNTPARFSGFDKVSNNTGRLRSELLIPSNKKILLYVGAITFNRGLEELIQSLEFLPECHLVYMGYGTEQFKKRLQDLACDLKVSDRFSFFGPVPTDQVIHYAAGVDLGVAPIANACLSYYFCSPNKLFEYMNAGLPVIASNFPELEKVVLGHHIGLTFDPANPQSIAEVARKILDNPAMREKMAVNALKASMLYNWENEAGKLLHIYDCVTDVSPRPVLSS
jgi:glycosyltransferase involved in cell wall biosynthesis